MGLTADTSTALRSEIERSNFPEFESRAPWIGPDLQTLRNVLRGPAFRSPSLERFERLEFPMADDTGDRLIGRLFRPTAEVEAPLVVLVHGLGGSADSAYIQTSTTCLLERGDRVLQLNLRGAGDSRPLCREQYHAGRSEDLRDALAGLPDGLTQSGIVVVGFSLGGNVALKYAAESVNDAVLGVASISAPIDLEAASMCFLEPRNRLYHIYLLNGMKREMLSATEGVSDAERRFVPKIKTILEFDERIVAPRNGFRDAADYYDQNNARQFLDQIEIPTLLMHALDDPWIPASAYADYRWDQNPNLVALMPKGGGHVGFHGRGSRRPWHDRCLAVFLDQMRERGSASRVR